MILSHLTVRYIEFDLITLINLFVDKIIPYDTENSLVDLLQSQNINIRFVGEDYKNKAFTGDDLNIKIQYTNRQHSFSTTSLRQRTIELITK